MSDVFHADVLATGYLPLVTAALYTAPAGKRVIIKAMSFVNEDATTRIINVLINGTRISPKDMELGISFRTVEDEPHMLYDGDAVTGDCDAASKVTFIIEGVVSE